MNEFRDITLETCKGWLPPRAGDCHKGCFGDVGIVGGAPGMAGAALLAGRSALWLGTGRVFVGMLDTRVAVDPAAPELMIADAARALRIQAPGCLIVGPGLGASDPARQALHDAIHSELALLIDADGLNLLSMDADLQAMLKGRSAPTVLTPHPGEAGRLLERRTADIQADRLASVLALGDRYRCVAVLKGAGTLVHAVGGCVWRNSTGNPGMAAPGMGDVLSGITAALIAQGMEAERAAVLGVCLHGAAGDLCVAEGRGPVGLTAWEVAQAARRLLNGWLQP
jgi:hydroxyethylthiazole kinase-like uncharacterized protein yjeF